MSSKSGRVRLDRLLANLGYGSRREIKAMVDAGEVTLHGVPIENADQHVVPNAELAAGLRILDEPVDPLPGMVVVLNKPLGVTCSHKDAGPLVYQLLPERWRRREPPLSTIGRLDKETSGLLLLTDDGQLLHRVIAPKSAVSKSYVATLARPLKGSEAAAFASGTLMLDGEDKPLLPALLQPLSATTARITISEGRYHQVRRMFAAVGNHVEALHRDRVGGLELPADLPTGEFRLLDAAAIAAIFAAPEAPLSGP